jgi:hypothetical protein
MSNKEQDRKLYNLEYPSHLKANTRLWITQEGDLMVKNGKAYKVCQVVRPLIKGSKPQIVLEEIEPGKHHGWTIPF